MATTYRISEWLLFFYIYCFLGWIWESSFVSIKEKHLVNRGFMKGPLLPIYGSGAICVLAVTLPVLGNYPMMAIIGMAAATVLEYVTGAVMEVMFKVRYWDYSAAFMNIKGYICLKSTLCWGAMTFLVVYGIQEPISWLVGQLPGNVIVMADYVITALAAADFATSFKAAIDFRDVLVKAESVKEELKGIQERLDELERQLAESAGNVIESSFRKKDELMEFGGRTRDGLVEFGNWTKDGLTGFGSKTKGSLTELGNRTKDSLTGFGSRTRDSLTGLGTRTMDSLTEFGSRTRDGLMGIGSRTKEQILAEIKELSMKKGAKAESLQGGYTKGVQGLLKRNPHTVSKKYSKTFDDVKTEVMERIRKRKRDDKKDENDGRIL
ncbi:MAG: putative ABC transporter permease [Lachnospiraceae bacterium]|nr:putative ABC transporter permease [Lachnospiraceae bacterium]MDD3795143.1 putative ABC transporter permease [Lachnospiraceae bacterium]